MVLDIGGGLFGQRDVRETLTENSTSNLTKYYSITGDSFHASNPDTDAVILSNGDIKMEANAITCRAQINIPNGSVISAVQVWGSATDETWDLRIRPLTASGDSGSAATGNFDSAHTNVNYTVNNSTHALHIITSSLDTGDEIHGVRITYI